MKFQGTIQTSDVDKTGNIDIYTVQDLKIKIFHRKKQVL